MAFPTKLILAVTMIIASLMIMITARPIESRSSLTARLKVAEDGGPSTCWEALSELKSCSGEVVMFFLNGETQLGANCCSAIKVIEHQCWPSMLGTLGINTQETNALLGFCAASDDGATSPPPAASTVEQCYNFPRLQH